jgi:ubiquinone biosynthesis protein
MAVFRSGKIWRSGGLLPESTGPSSGVRAWAYVRLFLRIFGPAAKLDLREIEAAGLLAVKIAQMYAVRGDLLGPEKAAKLAMLYEQAAAMEAGDFRRVFEREAGAELRRALAHLDEQPLAVASLGQVHRARLKDGREVVVKLLRADHAASFRRDAEAVRRLARLAVFFYPRLQRLADPLGTLEAIVRTTETEMDLGAEVRGTAELSRLRDEGQEHLPHLGRLCFPRILSEFSGPRILVSEYVAAPSVRRLLEERRFSYPSLLLLFRIHGYFLFHRGEFHGDLHPGNLLHDGERFWFVDNANVERVDRRFTRGLLNFLRRLGEGDADAAARALEALSERPLPDPGVFRKRFAVLYGGFGGRPVGEQSLTTQMMRTVRMAVESGLEFPPGAFPVIKSLMYLDGMALACAPEMRLLEDVVKFADDFG